MADEECVINKGDNVEHYGRTSRPDVVPTRHNALVDNVCPLETAIAVKDEPPDFNEYVCLMDDIANIKDETSMVSDVVSLEMDTTVKNETLDINDDVGSCNGVSNVKKEGSVVRGEVCPLDTVATVKQELDIGPTVLQSLDFKYKMLSRPESNVSQMKSHRHSKDSVNVTQRHLHPHAGEGSNDISNIDILQLPTKKEISNNTSETSDRCVSASTNLLLKTASKPYMLTHAGEEPYRCYVCSKNFSVKILFKRHMLTHTGIRPHRCDGNENFSQNSGLKSHTSIHTVTTINKGDCVQDDGSTSRPDAVSTRHNALADNVSPPKMAIAFKNEPLDANGDVCSTDDTADVMDEASKFLDDVCLPKMNTAVQNEPSDVNDDVCSWPGNTLSSIVWVEDCPLDAADIVKEELGIGPTVLQSPDLMYMMQRYKLDPESNVVQIKANHLVKYDPNATLTRDNSGALRSPSRAQYICCICNRTFVRKMTLQQHMITHTDERPHQCHICKKGFSLKSNLKVHMLTHKGERPYKCDVCKYSSTQNSNLKKHMLTHTGERPHKCDICKKRFSRKSHLNGHMLTHTGERPHQCDRCKYSSTNKYCLKNLMCMTVACARTGT